MTAVVHEIDPYYTENEHRYITLPNGLDALLVSNPQTGTSAAAMDCAVGQLNDPEELSGLAHFTEHMMFLGTGKFPEEGSYQEYIETNGGSCNAFTALDHTNYYFRVKASALDGALERFSRFFIDPLFTESATEREINAVESENQRFSTMDARRNLMWAKELVAEGHPFRQHGCGSVDTLKHIPAANGINVREAMFAFQKHYTAKTMKLCVFGKDSLDELQAMVMKYFKEIPDKGPTAPDTFYDSMYPLDRSKLGKMYFVKSVNTDTRLAINWVVKCGHSSWQGKPADYISHVLGHECEGSILRVLQKKNLATALCAGTRFALGKTYGLFLVEVNLSSAGFAQVEEVIHAIFEYLALMREQGFSDAVYQECKDTAHFTLKYAKVSSPFDHVSTCAGDMQFYPPRHCLSGSQLFFRPDPEGVKEMLAEMTPENAVISIKKHTFDDGSSPVPLDQVTRYYDTHYGVADIPEEKMKEWANPAMTTEGLAMPKPNEFIPNDFSLADLPDGKPEVPTKLPSASAGAAQGHWEVLGTPEVEGWHWQDDMFKEPKASGKFVLVSAFANVSPRARLLNALLVRTLVEGLTELSYFASLANLNVNIYPHARDGVEVAVGGFSQKMPSLLGRVFAAIYDIPDPTEELFEMLRERLHQELKNALKAEAMHHASIMTSWAHQLRRWSFPELLREIGSVTLAELVAFRKAFRQDVKVRFLLMGNITREGAQEVAAELHAGFLKHCRGISGNCTPSARTLQLPCTPAFFIIPMSTYDPASKNSVVNLTFQVGVETVQTVALAQIFDTLVRHLFFHHLRTVEQLGYIVQLNASLTDSVLGMDYTVQSAVAGPWYVFSRMYAFLDSLDAWIEELPAQEFKKIVDSLLERKREKPKTLNAKFGRWWSAVDNMQYDFERTEKAIAFLETVEQEEFTRFFKAHLSLRGTERRVLGTFLYGNEQQAELDGLQSAWKEAGKEQTTACPLHDFPRPLAAKTDVVAKGEGEGEGTGGGDAKPDEPPAAMDGYAGQFTMGAAGVTDDIPIRYVMQVAEFRNGLVAYPASKLFSGQSKI